MNAFAAIVALAAVGQPATPPPVVNPGPCVGPSPPPSDAIVLFDGTSLDGWTTPDGKPCPWTCENKPGGSMTIKKGSSSIISKHLIGSAQVHLEFMTPVVAGSGQDRGNSGLYLQGRYEIQVLDSFQNETYPDGQCGAIYGQHPPLVNACRKPGEWQTYDIIFHAAEYDHGGTKTAPARATVFHNGVLIHDNAEIAKPTGGQHQPEADTPGPLYLQEHGHEVMYRNIWVRPLK